MNKYPLKIIAGSPDKPLTIGHIEIQCYVLEKEQRVLSHRGLSTALLGSSSAGGEMPRLVGRGWIKPFRTNEITAAVNNPIIFANPQGGGAAYGYPADLLVDICNAIIQAGDAGRTTSRQGSIVRNAKILISGLAKIGIIALVDETTGYQEIREKRALATILEKYIADELRPWSKTFPLEFYVEIFRLKEWDTDPKSGRPSVIGHYTNHIVYARIAPGVLNELRRRNPVIPNTGRRQHKHHQWFTTDLGHPKLKEHLAAVLALMKSAQSWDEFIYRLDLALPAHNQNLLLPLPFTTDGSSFPWGGEVSSSTLPPPREL